MLAHDVGSLWKYASAELDSANLAVLEEHLTSCPECRDELDFIRSARLTLRAASPAQPRVDWNRVDDELGAAVARKMMRPGLGRWLRPVLAGALAVPVAVALIALFELPRAAPPAGPTLAVAAVAPVAPAAHATLTTGTRVSAGGKDRALAQGEGLSAGDRLRTAARGLALVELPDKSLVRLGASSDLLLVRSSPGEVALKLGRGRLAARAEHAPRRPFVIDVDGLLVRVVGTAFTVSSTAKSVEVAVGEGTVLIEPELGQSVLLGAGKRLKFDRAGWTSHPGTISAEQRAELAELGLPPPPAPSVRAAEELSRSRGGGQAPALRVSPGLGAPAPEGASPVDLSAPAPAANLASPAGLNAPAPAASLALPGGPVPLAPDVTASVPGGELPAEPAMPLPHLEAAPPLEPGVAPADEWLAFDAGASRKLGADESLPRDVEGLFLRRAEDALVQGKCERYELGLGELVESSESSQARERARVLRARCFDATLRPSDAEREYRLYLRDWPAGAWADEARGATEAR
jgi:hypothetical protein